MNIINMKCKVCPVGCDLKIIKDESDTDLYIVEGNQCGRGKDYGIKEVLQPSRMITSRVLLENGPMSRLPVRTSDIIPHELVDRCMEIIKETRVSAPVNKGDIIIKDILETGVDVIAARKVNSLK